MMITLFAISFGLIIAVAATNPLTDDFIDLINSKQTTWKAGRNFPKGTTLEHIKMRLGLRLDKNKLSQLPVRRHSISMDDLPENFDPREKWSKCPSLKEIRDHGCCGSSWAFAAVTAMTDRLCIYSNGTQQFHFSGQDLVSCDDNDGGCFGGDPENAWTYWVDKGLVSGGGFNSNEGCKPYEIPRDPNYTVCLIGGYIPTPKCETKCREGYDVDYEKDKRYGNKVYTLQTEADYMAELYQNGPIQVRFMAYFKFLEYKSGVYQHDEDDFPLGGYGVKLLGWGVENGTKYWLCANSWGTSWGDEGYFKVLRGTNECGIEDGAVAGEPKL